MSQGYDATRVAAAFQYICRGFFLQGSRYPLQIDARPWPRVCPYKACKDISESFGCVPWPRLLWPRVFKAGNRLLEPRALPQITRDTRNFRTNDSLGSLGSAGPWRWAWNAPSDRKFLKICEILEQGVGELLTPSSATETYTFNYS